MREHTEGTLKFNCDLSRRRPFNKELRIWSHAIVHPMSTSGHDIDAPKKMQLMKANSEPSIKRTKYVLLLADVAETWLPRMGHVKRGMNDLFYFRTTRQAASEQTEEWVEDGRERLCVSCPCAKKKMSCIYSLSSKLQFIQCITPSDIQGDHSGCSQPPIDIKTKVAFQYKPLILKHNFCFLVNGRLGTPLMSFKLSEQSRCDLNYRMLNVARVM